MLRPDVIAQLADGIKKLLEPDGSKNLTLAYEHYGGMMMHDFKYEITEADIDAAIEALGYRDCEHDKVLGDDEGGWQCDDCGIRFSLLIPSGIPASG